MVELFRVDDYVKFFKKPQARLGQPAKFVMKNTLYRIEEANPKTNMYKIRCVEYPRITRMASYNQISRWRGDVTMPYSADVEHETREDRAREEANPPEVVDLWDAVRV